MKWGIPLASRVTPRQSHQSTWGIRKSHEEDCLNAVSQFLFQKAGSLEGRARSSLAWRGLRAKLKAPGAVRRKMASHRLWDCCPIAGEGLDQGMVAGYEGWESQGGTNKG